MSEAPTLLVAVAGHDLAAGVVLHKLLELFPKSIRDDGAIWQADRYWLMQCGITYARMCRVRTRLSGLLDIWVANAQGAPTHHYRLRTEDFLRAVGAETGFSGVRLRAVLVNLEKGHVETRKSITSDSDSRLIDESETPSSSKSVVTETQRALVKGGVAVKAAGEFAAMPLDEALAIIDAARARQAMGKIRAATFAGYVVAMLRQKAEPHPRPLPKHGEGGKSSPQEHQDEHGEGGKTTALEVDFRPPAAIRLDELEMRVDERAREVWLGAKRQLEAQLDRNTFSTWIYPMRLVDFNDGEYVIGTTSPFGKQAGETRLNRTIRRILGAFAGCEGETLRLRFEVVT